MGEQLAEIQAHFTIQAEQQGKGKARAGDDKGKLRSWAKGRSQQSKQRMATADAALRAKGLI